MSWNVNLFVRGAASLAELVSQIERTTSFVFDVEHHGEETWFEYRDATVLITIGDHELSNDRDLTFEDYPFQIAFSSMINSDPVGGKRTCLDIARRLFETLQATEDYDLLLVENLQVKIASYKAYRMPSP
jgi:hypothetical protein